MPSSISDFTLVDKSKYITTTMKKRTHLQTQIDKADENINECSSFIIYDRRLIGDPEFNKYKEGVCQIDKKKN